MKSGPGNSESDDNVLILLYVSIWTDLLKSHRDPMSERTAMAIQSAIQSLRGAMSEEAKSRSSIAVAAIIDKEGRNDAPV